MKLTKFQHACLVIEKQDTTIVVDPGGFSHDFITPKKVDAIVITHEHPDHFDMNILTSIATRNPNVIVYAHESIISKLGSTIAGQAVAAGESIEHEPFHLEFFGGTHATIHESFEPVANLGVMINELLYYPGDSFTVPEKPVDTLALPISAPWLKVSEVMDYVTAVNPRLAFPTHDAVLSDTGKSLHDRMISSFAEKVGTVYTRINGEPIDI